MRLSLYSIIFYLNFFLAGVTSYIGGSLISVWLNYELFTLPISGNVSYEFEIDKPLNDSGKRKDVFDIILERNIFNAQKTQIDFLEVLAEESTDISEKSEDTDVQNTALSIALAGTMIYGGKNSFAFISKKNNLKDYVIFGMGECFNAKNIFRDEDCSDDSVKVLEIKDRWVLILYQGEKQALRMHSLVSVTESPSNSIQSKKIKNKNFIQSETTEIKSSKSKKNITKILEKNEDTSKNRNILHFKRVWVDEQLKNFEQLLNDARVVPIKKDEKTYFMFQFIKKESIYEKLGLKKNDIIKDINGFIVDSVDKALKLFEVLQSEREISLKVEREGKAVNFHYYIN